MNNNHQPAAGSCFQNYEQEAANQSNIILAFCIKQIFKTSKVKVDQYTLIEQLVNLCYITLIEQSCIYYTIISRAANLLDHLDHNHDNDCEDECMEFRAKCRNLLLNRTMEIHIVHKQQK